MFQLREYGVVCMAEVLWTEDLVAQRSFVVSLHGDLQKHLAVALDILFCMPLLEHD